MLVYKISEYNGGEFFYRETDRMLLQEIYNFMEVQEKGNTIFIEVVDISREEFNNHARPERF